MSNLSHDTVITHPRIVVGTDFSRRSEAALQSAVEVAQRYEGQLTLVHVLDTATLGVLPHDLSGEQEAALEQEALDGARRRLNEIAQRVSGLPVETLVRRGHAAKELARAAVLADADLIVVATQGRGAIGRAILGSVTSSLLGYASCPVLVVGEDRRTRPSLEKVLASVDLSPVSAAVLDQAFAWGRGGLVQVMSVFDEPILIGGNHPFSLQTYALPAQVRRLDEQHEAVSILSQAKAPEDAVYEVKVVPGVAPHLEILDMVDKESPDLVVVGASGHRTWSKALFGTNAAQVIAGCKTPVLVVPDPGFRPAEVSEIRGRGQVAPRGEEIIFAAVAPDAVTATVSQLVDAGIESDQLSVVMAKEAHERFKAEDNSDETFLAGTAVGTSVGGVLGGLASLAVSSGIGLVVVGPAVAMGLMGGLVGTLVGQGVPEHDAARLQDVVDSGETLVAVHVRTTEDIARAKTVFADRGARPRRLEV